MNHCRDCKHCSGYEWLGYRTCLLASGHGGRPNHDEALAFALDREMYSAELKVKPDFGCVQFQPKEKP